LTAQERTVTLSGEKEFIAKVYDVNNKDTLIYKGSEPCIVYFHADWCGPCRRFHPIYEELSEKYKNIKFYVVIDVDWKDDLIKKMNIKAIPYYLFIPLKKSPQYGTGFQTKEVFDQYIKDIFYSN